MPPPAAEIARAVIDAFLAKDFERAAQLQLQFALFHSKWMHRGLGPAMKAAMNLIGVALPDRCDRCVWGTVASRCADRPAEADLIS